MYMHYYNSLILYKLFKRPIQPIPIWYQFKKEGIMHSVLGNVALL